MAIPFSFFTPFFVHISFPSCNKRRVGEEQEGSLAEVLRLGLYVLELGFGVKVRSEDGRCSTNGHSIFHFQPLLCSLHVSFSSSSLEKEDP
mmetsp:Transcript_9823/g.14863  ORF Transcript_9823/g.14863 Transcript_9823/m.14863 type:complete len:91 (-) Transcript_9823:81-353(-)